VQSSAPPSPTSVGPQGPDDGRYRLLRRIGAGGMAEVFLARQRLGAELGERTVVVKRMHPHLADDAKFVRLFIREARLAALLQHPHIVQIHDVATLGGRAAIVMEHLRGIDALTALRWAAARARPIDPATAIAIAEQAALGLDHAHHAVDDEDRPLGIVHRDVSPHNLFLTRQGVVKILDFGVARSRLEETGTGSVKGKLAYMAPEQVHHRPVDARADLFALGIVLWELLTARRLFRGGSPAETLHALMHGPVPAPSAFVSVPPELDAVVLRALAREPTQRFPRGSELAAALARLRAELSDASGPVLVARLVEEVSPQENTPTVPTDPDSDVGHEPLPVDVAVGASGRIDAGLLGAAAAEDSEESADLPPAAAAWRPEAGGPGDAARIAAPSTPGPLVPRRAAALLGLAVLAVLAAPFFASPPAPPPPARASLSAERGPPPPPADPAPLPSIPAPRVDAGPPAGIDAGSVGLRRAPREGARPPRRTGLGGGIDRDYP
jgi:serine/threonine protein kinase